MPDGDSYIVRGAKMKCSCGSVPRQINLPISHGNYINGKPMMNETDNKTMVNISVFGACSIIKTCMPNILANWVMTKQDTKVDSKAALTTQSKLICANGGIISFINDGQQG